MAKHTATDKVLNKIRKQNLEFEPKNPIATDMFLPNHSGISVHPEMTGTGGFVKKTGDTMTGDLILATGVKIGLGIASPDGALHIFEGTAGDVKANTAADGLTVEDNTDTGISILSPDGSFSNLFFGAASSNTGALIRWKHSTKIMQMGTNFSAGSFQLLTDAGTLALDVDSSQNFNFQDGNLTTTGAILGGGTGHDQFSDFVANEHIDWTSTSSNLSTSGTATLGATTITGELNIASKMIHTGDTDTSIDFSTNQILIFSGGGLTRIRPGEFVVNESADDMDFRVEGTSIVQLLKVNAETNTVGINVANPLGMLHIDQSGSTEAKPTLILDQADESEGFINFIGSDRGTGTMADSDQQASVRVEINGTVYRLALYTDA